MQNVAGKFWINCHQQSDFMAPSLPPPSQSCPIKFLEPFLIRPFTFIKQSTSSFLFKFKIMRCWLSSNNIFLKTNLWCSKSFNFNLQSIFQLRQIEALKWVCHFTIFQCINWNNFWGIIVIKSKTVWPI